MKLSTDPISSIMAKHEMEKNIHLQMGKCLPFGMEFFLEIELPLLMFISYFLSKIRDKHCRTVSKWQNLFHIKKLHFKMDFFFPFQLLPL